MPHSIIILCFNRVIIVITKLWLHGVLYRQFLYIVPFSINSHCNNYYYKINTTYLRMREQTLFSLIIIIHRLSFDCK